MEDVTSGLFQAASNGDVQLVAALIRDGADVSNQEDVRGSSPLMAAALAGHAEVVAQLLAAGAPWNALDRAGLCAGDYAMSSGHEDAMELLVDAGLRSELILGAAARSLTAGKTAANRLYLTQRVQYSEGRMLDEAKSGVMMSWEAPLMEAHAHAICQQGGDILNIGFGMGIVDAAIQRRGPSSHTIVEAHPDVYARMVQEGWPEKPGVKVVRGRWQDVLPELGQYDGIFFDTYGEYYDDLREFHQHLPQLLRRDGVYSFFNGLCGDNAFFHVVYCKMVELEMARIGLSVNFIPLPVGECLSSSTWVGVQQPYWQLDQYFLPVCTWEEVVGTKADGSLRQEQGGDVASSIAQDKV